ncbi:hypothetical protein JCM11491_003001 [Sporobolomyces phaffii]
MVEQYSPTKRSRPLSFALPSSSSHSFNRPLSPDASRPTHRSTASLSSLAQLNLSGPGAPSSSAHPHSHSHSHPHAPHTPALERSPSLHWGTFSTAQSPSFNSGNSSQNSVGVGKEFEHVQNKTFAKWLNARLEPHGYPPVNDLGTDFSDGTRLIQLIEVLTEESMGRFNHTPVLRVQKMENTKQALDRIKEMGVHLTNIGPEDIVDGNRKLILGMIWSLVLRFSIADINEEGSHAKEGLLLWCQRKTNGYRDVEVKDFTKSWMDGLALCALIHRHRPDLLDFDALHARDAVENLSLAFQIAERHLGIPQLLDVEDVCGPKRPDERSVMTYIAQFFHAFSSKAQQENESRVISHFVENMSELMVSVHDYERRMASLLSALSAHLHTLRALPSPSLTPYSTLVSLLTQFTTSYYLSTRRPWVRERVELGQLLARITEKLKTYGLKGYEPPEGARLEDLDARWRELEAAETRQVEGLKDEIGRLRRDATRRVKALIAEVVQELDEVRLEMTPTGPSTAMATLENQLERSRALQTSRLPRLRQAMERLDEAESSCLAHDVPIPILLAPLTATPQETTTVHSAQGLRFEFDLVESTLAAKIAFLENQIVARKQTLLKPEQLEEFESAFRAFDKDSRNRLGLDELVGAFGSLGVAEINLEEIHQDENDEVSFEEFIRFLTARAEDRLTGDKVRSCFRSVASEKGYVTELDLTRLQLPTAALQFLQEHMPQSRVHVLVDEQDEQAGTKEEVVLDYEEFLNQFLE